MKITLIMGTLFLAGTQVNAAELSGLYKVAPAKNCTLQENTIEKIDAGPTGLTMSLYNAYDNGAFSTMFKATSGDTIKRPADQFAAMGAQTVRTISGYSTNLDSFSSSEYRYATNLSDAAGTATGFFSTTSFTLVATGIQYDLHYSDGETYLCTLTRIP